VDIPCNALWGATGQSRPLLAVAGLWTNRTRVRKAKEREVTCNLFGILTCEPNAEVRVGQQFDISALEISL
jgi:hypothetical protein